MYPPICASSFWVLCLVSFRGHTLLEYACCVFVFRDLLKQPSFVRQVLFLLPSLFKYSIISGVDKVFLGQVFLRCRGISSSDILL